MYDFKELKQAIEDTTEHYKNELSSIRTGQAAPALLDGVKVEAYESTVPLNQVGSVTIEDARTLRVAAWDLSQIKAVEDAIRTADLGVSISTDEKGVRVSFPELTSDRREQLMKLTRTKLEESRTSMRQGRDNTWQNIQNQEKEKEISEDEKFTAKEEMEKIIKQANSELENLATKKEAELSA